MTPEPPEARTPERPPQPLEARLPPAVFASPVEVSKGEADDIQWWHPDWRETLRHVGWRWVLLTPALGVLGLYLLSWKVFMPDVAWWVLEVKLGLFVLGIALALAGYVVRKTIQARTEPFCIYCGYGLSGLPDNYRCPECSRPYTWRLIAEYRRDPHWFIERWKQSHALPTAQQPFDAGPVKRKRRARDGTE